MAELTAVKGLGEWSAHMFLMFQLERPDVLAVGDLGHPARGRARLRPRGPAVARTSSTELAEPWRPYRSAACRLLWHSLAHPVAVERAPCRSVAESARPYGAGRSARALEARCRRRARRRPDRCASARCRRGRPGRRGRRGTVLEDGLDARIDATSARSAAAWRAAAAPAAARGRRALAARVAAADAGLGHPDAACPSCTGARRARAPAARPARAGPGGSAARRTCAGVQTAPAHATSSGSAATNSSTPGRRAGSARPCPPARRARAAARRSRSSSARIARASFA